MTKQKIQIGKVHGHLFVEEIEEDEVQPLLPPGTKPTKVTEEQLRAVQGKDDEIGPMLPTWMSRRVEAEPKPGEKPPPDILLPTGMNK